MLKPNIGDTPTLVGKHDQPFCDRCQVDHPPLERLCRMLQSSDTKLVSGAAMWCVELAKFSDDQVRQHMFDCDMDFLMEKFLEKPSRQREQAIRYFSYMVCFCQPSRRVELFDVLLPLTESVTPPVRFAFFTMLANLCIEHKHLGKIIIDSGMFERAIQRYKHDGDQDAFFAFLSLPATILRFDHAPKIKWETAYALFCQCCSFVNRDRPVVTHFICQTMYNIVTFQGVNQKAIMSAIVIDKLFRIAYTDHPTIRTSAIRILIGLCLFGTKHLKTLLKNGLEELFDHYKDTEDINMQRCLLTFWNTLLRSENEYIIGVCLNYIETAIKYARHTNDHLVRSNSRYYALMAFCVGLQEYNDRLISSGAMPILWCYAISEDCDANHVLTVVLSIIENVSEKHLRRIWNDYTLVRRTRQAANIQIPYAVDLFVYENGPYSPWRQKLCEA